MDDPLIISLVVSGIGMLMLFVALALLYGLMYLMTAFITDRPKAVTETGEEGSRGAEEQRRSRLRAAAVAVALARAEQELSAIGAPGEEGAISPWRVFHHHRQLTLNPRTRGGR